MTKAVMMSIQPKWVEKILNGEKTREVRKTAPKLKTPFKVYIYCTKGGELLVAETSCNYITIKRDSDIPKEDILNGKIVAEFTCDYIVYEYADPSMSWLFAEPIEHDTCLTFSQLREYLGTNLGCFWHISDLKIYDKPRELGEFQHLCPQNNENLDGRICEKCKYKGFFGMGYVVCCDSFERPPQSWGYCKEIKND